MRAFAKKFYKSAAWKSCREAYLQSVDYTCERCGEAALIVHHKIYIDEDTINDPTVSLNWENLEAVCLACHNAEHDVSSMVHLREEPAGRCKFDEDGRPFCESPREDGPS